MAVQAQYPSNVLLLNRSVQEGKNQQGNNNYSLQQPQYGIGGGGVGGSSFLDSTQMLFNPGVTRKRAREGTVTSTTTSTMNQFMQSHPQPQLIDLTLLHAPPQHNGVSTGLRLAFGDQQHQHQHQLQQKRQQQQQNPHSLSRQSSQSSAFYSMILTEDLATNIKHQHDEIEQFLQVQGEQLRRTLEEKRQRNYRALLGAAEESISRRLREKEAEVVKAVKRNGELEARAMQLSAEARAWQARARAQELTAATLQSQIHQAMMNGGGGGACGARHLPERDDGSCAGGGEADDAESGYIDPDRGAWTAPGCKACRKRVASVVLLPCRHMCLCTECDAVAHACPLCFSIRSSSVEVLFS